MTQIPPLKVERRFLEARLISDQRYELWTWTHLPDSLYLYHTDATGVLRHETWTHFTDHDAAWAEAAHHSWLIALTGHCHGTIPVRLSERAQRVHIAGLESHHTICGIEFVGSAARYRVPGSVRARGVITCQRCH
jgi:hypothetical protein